MKLQHISVRGILVVPCHPAASSPYLALFPSNLVSNGPADAALVSLSVLRWHPFMHPAGGITSIVLSSSPALRRRHCPHCMGIFALIVLDLSPTLHLRCHKHCKLASAPSQRNHDTSAYMALSLCSLRLSVVFVAVTSAIPWQLGLHVQPILRWWFLTALRRHHCPCRAGVLASIVLSSFPELCWRCHQRRVGLFALIALASPPASQTSVCPTKTQLRHIRVHGIVVMVIILVCGLIAVPGVVPW
jgi:hypothetical protein